MKNLEKIIKGDKKGIIIPFICVLLILSILFYFTNKISYSANKKMDKNIKKTEKVISKTYPKMLKSNGESKDKIETTYVIMDKDGKEEDVIVSEQLSNNKNEKELKDYSTLSNIENTSGNEKYSKSGNEINWEADGNKIEYKGKATEKLPVNVKISYYLNGEKKRADDIAGKSGNVKIRFDYEISKKDFARGRYYAHPYTMASGLILENDNFSDVTVTNGKAIDDGNKTVAMGIAFPSMNENLGIEKSKLDIPSYVEISAYTDNFNILGTYSIAMSGIFNDLDTSKADDINSKMNMLNDNLNKLSDSSKKLLEATDELSNGSTKLDKGISDFKSGSEKLYKGSNEILIGAKALGNGLQKLNENSPIINEGMKKLEESIFENATVEIREKLGDENINLSPDTYIQVIQGISDKSIQIAEKKLRDELKTAGVSNISSQNQILSVAYNKLMIDGKSEADRGEIKEAIEYASKMGERAVFVQKSIIKNKEMAKNILIASGHEEKGINDESIALMSTAISLANGDVANIESKMSEATEYLKSAGIFKDGNINALENVRKLASIAVGKETPKKLSELKDNLDQFEALKAGINEYTNGVNSLAIGSKKLVLGMTDLNNGIEELNNSGEKLKGGSKSLREGIDKLNKGMNRFDREGISKFVNTLKASDLKKITSNLEGIKEASRHEVFVGGKADEMSGESKIIFKTGEIK